MCKSLDLGVVSQEYSLRGSFQGLRMLREGLGGFVECHTGPGRSCKLEGITREGFSREFETWPAKLSCLT